LYAAYFTDNRELADKDLLLSIAVNCGFDAGEVKAVLDSDKYHDEVVLDEREAARYGIHAVPVL
jgi:predicted DsbA family dithiol-disulfide isomerase